MVRDEPLTKITRIECSRTNRSAICQWLGVRFGARETTVRSGGRGFSRLD